MENPKNVLFDIKKALKLKKKICLKDQKHLFLNVPERKTLFFSFLLKLEQFKKIFFRFTKYLNKNKKKFFLLN